MKLRTTPSGLVGQHADGSWRAVPGDDLLVFLAAPPAARTEVAQRLGRAEVIDEPAAAPFRPRSVLVVEPWAPILRTTVATATTDVGPALACVLVQPLWQAAPSEALEAIGGWFVLGPERTTGVDRTRGGSARPRRMADPAARPWVVGEDVITADDLPDWTGVRGRVRVDGEVWCEGRTAGPVHPLGELIAHASLHRALEPGDVISTGTMPGCRTRDHGRRVPAGRVVELEIDGIGRLTHGLPDRFARARGERRASASPGRDDSVAAPPARSPQRPIGG